MHDNITYRELFKMYKRKRPRENEKDFKWFIHDHIADLY